MARIRTIRPAFFRDEQIAELTPVERLTLIGLWSLADQDGRVFHSAKRIGIELFPYEHIDVAHVLNSLVGGRLITISHQDDGDVIEVENWQYWQPETKREPRGNKARLWRNSVLYRDGYQCRNCGSEDDLEAHHKLSWADHPEQRFNVANGITLCAECHKSEHRNRGQ